jgi:hypothetical protein
LSNNPAAQKRGRPLCGGQWKSQNINFPIAVVSLGFGLVRICGCGQECLAQGRGFGQRDAENSLENPRFVPPLAMQEIEHVILKLRAEVCLFSVRKFHVQEKRVRQPFPRQAIIVNSWRRHPQLGVISWSGFGHGWLGRLPGDVHYHRGNFNFYFPVVTCILLSIVLTLILRLFRK